MQDNPYSAGNGMQEFGFSSAQLGQLRVAQIICGALASGVLFLLGVGLVMIEGDLNGNTEMFVLLAAGIAVGAVLLHGVMASRFPSADQLREYRQAENPAEPLARFFVQRLITTLAVLEGAAVMNAVAIMVSRSWVSVIAVSCLVVMMLFRFPTAESLRNFTEAQLQQL